MTDITLFAHDCSPTAAQFMAAASGADSSDCATPHTLTVVDVLARARRLPADGQGRDSGHWLRVPRLVSATLRANAALTDDIVECRLAITASVVPHCLLVRRLAVRQWGRSLPAANNSANSPQVVRSATAPDTVNLVRFLCWCPQNAHAPSSARPRYVPAATRVSRNSPHLPLGRQCRASS